MKLALGNSLATQRIGGAAAWSPLALSPLIWLDATQLSGLANDDPVAEFTDLSGNGNHFVQGTTPNKPTFVASGINGLASVDGDGVDDNMTVSGLGAQTAWTAFIVFKQMVADTGENTFWSIADYPSSGTYKMLEKAAGADAVAGLYTNAFPGFGGSMATFTAGLTRAVLIHGNATTGTQKEDTGGTTSTSANHSRADDIMRIFGRGDGNYAPAQIGELLFFNSVLSAEDQATLWAYSAAKWGHADPS